MSACAFSATSVVPDRHHGNHVEHQGEAEELGTTHQISRKLQGENLFGVLCRLTSFSHPFVHSTSTGGNLKTERQALTDQFQAVPK
jgi:hypothetical protein